MKGLLYHFPGYLHPGFPPPGLESAYRKFFLASKSTPSVFGMCFVCNSNHMKGVEIPKSLRDYWKAVVKNQPAEVFSPGSITY